MHISGKVQRDKIREIKAEKIVDIAKEEVKAGVRVRRRESNKGRKSLITRQ